MGACPHPRCHNLNHQPSKQGTLRLSGYIQGGTSGCAKGMLEVLLRQLLREGVRDEVRRVIED